MAGCPQYKQYRCYVYGSDFRFNALTARCKPALAEERLMRRYEARDQRDRPHKSQITPMHLGRSGLMSHHELYRCQMPDGTLHIFFQKLLRG